MATDISNRVREIARYRDSAESEVIERALERGLEDLWRDVVVTRYLEGEIDRETAVEEVGHDVVDRADAASDAVDTDVDWALGEESV
jgi:predicted transcriptional regulator